MFSGLEVSSLGLFHLGCPVKNNYIRSHCLELKQVTDRVSKERAKNTGRTHFLCIFSEVSTEKASSLLSSRRVSTQKEVHCPLPALYIYYKFKAHTPHSVAALKRLTKAHLIRFLDWVTHPAPRGRRAGGAPIWDRACFPRLHLPLPTYFHLPQCASQGNLSLNSKNNCFYMHATFGLKKHLCTNKII